MWVRIPLEVQKRKVIPEGDGTCLLSIVIGEKPIVDRYHCFPQIKRGRGVTACISPCHGEGWGSNPPVSAKNLELIFFLEKQY